MRINLSILEQWAGATGWGRRRLVPYSHMGGPGMRAEIVCIGTELLLGEIVDTNAAFLARQLAELGIDLYYKSTVGDNLERIVETLERAWQRSDLLLLSGGLGPTQDDLTRFALAQLIGEELTLNEEALAQVEGYFARRQRLMPEINRQQALLPPSARPLPNPRGTAPGIWLEKDGKYIVALPGVPLELKMLMTGEVLPRLRQLLGQDHPGLITRVLKTTGIGESALEERITDLLEVRDGVTIAPYVKHGEIHLRLAVKAATRQEGLARMAPLEAALRERLATYIYGADEERLEDGVGRLLLEQGLTLGLAESCTGGLLGHRITEVPGSSAYFMLGIVAYSNEAKKKLLGVEEETLRCHGAVSPETAEAMAKGLRRRYGVDLGLATTGIAGPGGGTPEKPVGLVYTALAAPGGVQVLCHHFPWDRTENKLATAQAGLTMLWQYLAKQ
jgi:nicotinamide-nucleotide amidase